MRDLLGNEIKKGDRVVYTIRDSGQLRVGLCINLTPKKVKILMHSERKEKTYRYPDEVVVVNKKAKSEVS